MSSNKHMCWLLCALTAPAVTMAEEPPEAIEDPAIAAFPLESEPGIPARPLKWFRYPLAIVEGAAFNLSLNLSVRYIADEDWARISIDSIRQNGETGWVWDEDLFSTNQFSHPYHGAILYNFGRIHGLTYWEALPVTALGSWEWERFLETDAPSINDQVTTTLAGAFVGEIFWRLSSQILDGSSSGRIRLVRELAAAAVDPPRGLDRLITQKAWHSAGGTVRVPIEQKLGVGFQVVGEHTNQVRLHYRLRYGGLRLKKPLDAFEASIDGLVTTDLKDAGVEIFLSGGLVGVQVGKHHLIGIFQHYDYFAGPTLRIGSTAIGPAWWADAPLGERWSLSVRASLMAVPVAGADSPFAQLHTERSYIFGQGAQSALRLELGHEQLGHVFAEARAYAVHSSVPPHGEEFISWVSTGVTGQLTQHLGLGIQTTATARRGDYRLHGSYEESFVAVQALAISSF